MDTMTREPATGEGNRAWIRRTLREKDPRYALVLDIVCNLLREETCSPTLYCRSLPPSSAAPPGISSAGTSAGGTGD